MRTLKMFIFVLITAYSFSPWAGDLEPDKVGQKRVRESNQDEPSAKKSLKSLEIYFFEGDLERVKSWLKMFSIEENKENFIRELPSTVVDLIDMGFICNRDRIRNFSLIALFLIVNDRESRFRSEIELDLKKMLAEAAQGEEPWKDLDLPSSKGVINYIISFLKKHNLLSQEELDTLSQSSNYPQKVIENKKILEVEALALSKACEKEDTEEITRIFDKVKTLLDPAFYSSSGWLSFYTVLLQHAPRFSNFPQTADVTKFISKNFPKDAFKIFLAALYLKNYDIAQLLIDSGLKIDSNTYVSPSDLDVLLNFQEVEKKWYQGNLLHFAAEKNYFWWVEFLVKNNFDVNLFGNAIETPLHTACRENNLDSVEKLVQHKATLGIYNSRRVKATPIMLATDVRVLEFLKTKKAPFDKKQSKFDALKWACENSDLKVLQFWKGYGYPFKNGYNKTLFQFAITKGWVKDEQTFQALLELSGESVNHQDKGGSSALMNACYNRNIKVVEWLIKAGADLDLTKNSQQFSALHYAGPKPKGCRLNGYDKQIIALLIANNARVADDLKGDENFGVILQLKNQLLQAISNNNIMEVKYVLDQEEIGPQLALSKDITGKHAIDIASELGHEEIVQLLLKYNPQKPKIPTKSARK